MHSVPTPCLVHVYASTSIYAAHLKDNFEIHVNLQNMTSLPILSLPTLFEDAAPLRDACRNVGFFYLTDHGIPTARMAQVLDLARSFFLTASDNEKQELARKAPDLARGYQRLGENVTLGKRDAHEAIDFYREIDDAFDQPRADGLLAGHNQWPRTPPELEAELKSYIDDVLQVGSRLVKAMGLALGLEHDIINEATSKSFWVARMIGYPPLQAADGESISCGEHTGTSNVFDGVTADCSRLRMRHTSAGRFHKRRVGSADQGRFVDACRSRSRCLCSQHW